jgi:hypothetical protein
MYDQAPVLSFHFDAITRAPAVDVELTQASIVNPLGVLSAALCGTRM